MRIFAALECSQRLIIATGTAWFTWCVLAGIDAPYNPNGFLLIMFCCSVVMLFLACIWAVAPLTPADMWLPWKILTQSVIAFFPFFMIVIIGHYIVVEVKVWLA